MLYEALTKLAEVGHEGIKHLFTSLSDTVGLGKGGDVISLTVRVRESQESMAEGLALMEAWGFEYKTLGFSWHKTNKNGSLFFGVGAYAKSNCEVCLLGTRGKVGRHMDKTAPFPDPKEKLVVRSNYVSSAINSQKEKHSKKPDELRDRIVELFGDVSRIELFARNATDGWEIWGSDESINENSMQYKNIQDTLMGNDLNLDSRDG